MKNKVYFLKLCEYDRIFWSDSDKILEVGTYSYVYILQLSVATHPPTQPPISLLATHLPTQPPISLLATHLPTQPPISLLSHPSPYWATHLPTEPPISLLSHPIPT